MFGFQGSPVLVLSGAGLDSGPGAAKGAQLLVDETVAGALWAQVRALGAEAAGEAVWERARVAVGRPRGAREVAAASARRVGGAGAAEAEELWGVTLSKVVAVGDSVSARGTAIGARRPVISLLTLSLSPLISRSPACAFA